jgi:GTP cyclohydrolase FolE2
LRLPVRVRGADELTQQTVARVDMYVSLPALARGTHMSRFIEVIEANSEPIHFESMRRLMRTMLSRLGAAQGEIVFNFPYFIRKRAPVSGAESFLDPDVTLVAAADSVDSIVSRLEVCVPVTSLCPCSKQISAYGAHNQRSYIRIAADLRADMSIEELVSVAETAASCELYGLLKRPDEKYVTERAYENPKFVEDIVRDTAARLNIEPRIARYRLSVENVESIHNHSAYAQLERDKSDETRARTAATQALEERRGNVAALEEI